MKLRINKGITLMSLVITIVVLVILASVATYSGMHIINSSKLTAFTAEMKIMQSQVNSLYHKWKNGGVVTIEQNGTKVNYTGDDILNLGSDLDSHADIVLTSSASGITDKTGYRLFENDLIKALGIEGVEQNFFINIQKRSVVSYKGLKYEGQMYYTLEQLPKSLYNVEYDGYTDGNIDKPTFDVESNLIGENKWKVEIKNIKFDGNINKWQVQYKPEGTSNWSTSEDFSFVVDGNVKYEIRVLNGDIISEVQTKYLGYAEEDLYLYYDSISNTENGHSSAATTWKDLSGNNHDGTVIGAATWNEDSLICDGTDDYVDTGIKQSELGQEITIQTVANFQEIANYRGLYGLHVKTGISAQCDNGLVYFFVSGIENKECSVGIEGNSFLNKKTHITVVMRQGGKKIQVYLDGKKVKESQIDDEIKLLDDYEFVIAKSLPSDERYFKGTISNFKIYKRALTDEEIEINYKLDKVRFGMENVSSMGYLEYAKDDLYLYYDSIYNSENGHNSVATTWKDLSGNNHDGTVIGAATWNEDSLICDGTDDYIDTGIKQSELGQEITIQTVANFQEIAPHRGLYGYHQADPNWWGIMQQCADDRVGFTMYCGAEGRNCAVNIPKGDLLNQKKQITVIMQGGKGIKVYINGNLAAENTTTYNIKPRDDYNFIIARSYPSDNRYFKGTISNFKIYKRALTETEIETNYKLDKLRFGIK